VGFSKNFKIDFSALAQPEVGHSILVAVTPVPNAQVRWSLYSSSTWLCLNTEGFHLAPSARLVH